MRIHHIHTYTHRHATLVGKKGVGGNGRIGRRDVNEISASNLLLGVISCVDFDHSVCLFFCIILFFIRNELTVLYTFNQNTQRLLLLI